jgi:hypothetical protein
MGRRQTLACRDNFANTGKMIFNRLVFLLYLQAKENFTVHAAHAGCA